KDVPLRVKAGAVGLEADEYHAQDVVLTGYTGMANVHVSPEVINDLFSDGEVIIDEAVTDKGMRVEDLPVHCGVTLQANQQSALGRVMADGQSSSSAVILMPLVCRAVLPNSALHLMCSRILPWGLSPLVAVLEPVSPPLP